MSNEKQETILKHWIKSAARWIKCHDIYHTSGDYLIKQAKEILNDDGEFLFKRRTVMAKYKFKGYTISCCGYHQPDHCVWWEAVDDSGCASFHGTTLREVEFMILDSEWEDKIKAKDREIAELRECLREAVREKCPFTRMSCNHGELCDYECGTEKWRKALKGVKDGE